MHKLFKCIMGLAVIALLTGCGPAATQLPASTEALFPLPTPSSELVESTSTTAAATTSEPFAVQFTPAPTETPLPTFELPSPVPSGPVALQIWDGLPTYMADSRPDFDFRLRFDPNVWALTKNDFGFPAIIHRTIPFCAVSPSSGHGLPPNMTVEHDIRKIGAIDYQVNTAFLNGVKQFVTYSGGDGIVFTAFEVAFQGQADQCLKEAETVLATLTSIPASQATPVPTP